MIPDAKRRALVEALRSGPVRFKSGAVVKHDPLGSGDLLVERADGNRRSNVFAHDQIAYAYLLAVEPVGQRQRPVARVKPTRSQTDFGDCPF